MKRHGSFLMSLGLAVLLCGSGAIHAADAPGGIPDSTSRIVPAAAGAGRTYLLPATPETTVVGIFDSEQTPVLAIDPGDTVALETQMVFGDRLVPGMSLADLPRLRAASMSAGASAHTLTGPIYVRGAEPGDVLKVHFNKIEPRLYGVNFNLPGVGGEFPHEFPQGSLRWVYLDWDRKTAEFLPGIVIPLRPFPGTIGVARARPGRYSTNEPGPFGGNMDLREIVAGTTLYLPVFVRGALLWTGDSHAAQGNGEVNTTAIETAFKELNITIDVQKNLPLDWPRIETPTHWITVGYDRDLNRALEILEAQTIALRVERGGVPGSDAREAMLRTWDCAIAEVVDVVKGAYCRTPKDRSANPPKPLPTAETATDYVTIGSSEDLNAAMDIASLAMIDLLVAKRGLDRLDAYGLASVAMDCRIAPPASGRKSVHCLVPKSLWTSGGRH